MVCSDRRRSPIAPAVPNSLHTLTRAGTNGVLAPDWFAAEFHVSAGESIGLAVSGGSRREVPVIGVYRDVESGPGLPAWCVLEPAFATNQFGDHRSPVLILDDAGARTYRGLFAHGETRWELPIAGTPTASTAATYLRDLAPARAAGTRIGAPVAGELDFVVHRAAQIRSFTSASIAPVRWSGALTGTGLVVAAALLFARRNRRELRIRVLRGARPARLGAEAAVRLTPPALAGAVAGVSAAAFLVRTFGPSSDLDTRGRFDAVWLSLLGVAVALAAVAVTVAVSSRVFDRQRPPRPSRLRWVPFELVAAVVSFVAFRHLAHSGGVKLAGADASSVDPWAVLFPLLLVWTVLLALGRPAVAVLRRLRALGAGARPHVMLGVRRAVNDPAVGLVTCGAVALCLTTFVYASTLSTSIDSSLRAKAHMFAGADERVGMTSVEQLDPSLAGHATVVTRGQGTFGGAAVTVLGVDPVNIREGRVLAALVRLVVPVRRRAG